jgi:hypothetical protein
MLLPDKHIRISESLLGLGSFVIGHLNEPKSLDTLWSDMEAAWSSGAFPTRRSFEDLVLTLDFLYAIEAIREEAGRIVRCV